MEIINRKK